MNDNKQPPSDRLSLSQLARRYELTPDELRRRLTECGMAVGGEKDLCDPDAVDATLAQRDRRVVSEIAGRLLGGMNEDFAAQILADAMREVREKHHGTYDSEVLQKRREQLTRSLRCEISAQMPCSIRSLLVARNRAGNAEVQAEIDLQIAAEFNKLHADLATSLATGDKPEATAEPAADATPSPVPTEPAVEPEQTEPQPRGTRHRPLR